MTLPSADFSSHHIEGYARAAMEAGENGYFHVPLISHIEGNLWVGGCRQGVRLPDDFRFVISLYPWEKYELGPDTRRVEVVMHDVAKMPPIDVLLRAADAVNRCLDRGKTLVHCQAGLNRSNLIAGLALIKRGRKPSEAIALLREKRSPMVLCNQTFEQFLERSLDAAS